MYNLEKMEMYCVVILREKSILLGSDLVPKLTVALEDYLNIGFVPSLDKAFL